MKTKNKINIFDLMKKGKPIKSNVNLYTMYKVKVTKKKRKKEKKDDTNN